MLKVNGGLVFELSGRTLAGLELHVVSIQKESVSLELKCEDRMSLGDSYRNNS